MDSHADTSCVNKHAFIEAIVDGMTVDAIPFDETIGRLSNLPVVHAIYTFDNMNTGETMLLRINHAIYVENMKNALLCPSQARCYGTIVDDIPPHLDHSGQSTFSLHTAGVGLPLTSYGPTAFLHVCRPTED